MALSGHKLSNRKGVVTLKRVVDIELIKQTDSKYEVKVEGVKVAVFMQWENALQYEKDIKELNPYMEIRNRWAKD